MASSSSSSSVPSSISHFSLLKQQTKALIKKNYLLCLRNKRPTFLQIFSSLVFIALLFGIQESAKLQAQTSVNRAMVGPKPATSFPIPPCEAKLFLRRPCFDFVWSGNGSPRIQSIVKNIMENNPGRRILPHKVKSFRTKRELAQWLTDNPNLVPAVLHFEEINEEEISYAVEINSTSFYKIGRRVEDPILKYQTPLQLAASSEITRSLTRGLSSNTSLTEFAHPTIKAEKGEDERFIYLFTQVIVYATSIYVFIFQTRSLVQEKELKLRQAMTTMGLYDTAYWCSWLIWEGLITILSSSFIVVCGQIFRVDLFTKNNFMIVFLLFLLFQLSMVGFACLLSIFMSKSSSATTVCFTVVIVGLMANFFSNLIYSDHMKKSYRIMCSLFPPSPFAKGLNLLWRESRRDGFGFRFRLSDLSKCTKFDCFTMIYCYKWLASTFFLWFFLALYLDNVFANTSGARKSIFYFLQPSYWTGKGETKFEEETNTLPPPNDEGVIAEEELVKKQAKDGIVDPDVVQLRGLAVKYPKSTCRRCWLCCCSCSLEHETPFQAVKGLWLNLPKGQLFCLLGPNGAGKTTTIGCLTGIIPVTRGDAIIYGNSIRSPASLATIRRMTGVCTQYDTLWEKLSAREHLELCACIKGSTPDSRNLEANVLLHEVRLTEAADVRSGSYTDGMKRRLSLAIALIGKPKLVILDEPTTGLDPITQKHLWDVIEYAKEGRSVILTTHSMEEADELSDRIGIMSKGRLCCIGTSTTLKSKFAPELIVKISFRQNAQENDIEDVKHFFRERLNVFPIDDNKPLTFAIAKEQEYLIEDFFVEAEEREYGISKIQIGLPTLEQVFLHIAQEAELEAAIPQQNN